jgi:hypothetical protein
MIELRTTCGWRTYVHKSLLCHYSTYCEAAICGEFQEATRGHFTLKLDRKCADWFVRWLYSGQLGNRAPCPDDKELYRLYIFADEKDILALRRAVMNRLVGSDYLSCHEMAFPVNSLPPSAPLYNFVVEWYTQHWFHPDIDIFEHGQLYEGLPKEFLYLVMCGIESRAEAVLKSGKRPSCACCDSPCRFHEHANREEWLESKSVCSFFLNIGTDLWTLACLHLGDAKYGDCPKEFNPSQRKHPTK